MKGDVLLGRLTDGNVDQPWCVYDFEAEPAFANYRSLFAAELRSLNNDNMDAWERDYQFIENLKLTLAVPDGPARITDFILHIDDGKAWFRSS